MGGRRTLITIGICIVTYGNNAVADNVFGYIDKEPHFCRIENDELTVGKILKGTTGSSYNIRKINQRIKTLRRKIDVELGNRSSKANTRGLERKLTYLSRLKSLLQRCEREFLPTQTSLPPTALPTPPGTPNQPIDSPSGASGTPASQPPFSATLSTPIEPLSTLIPTVEPEPTATPSQTIDSTPPTLQPTATITNFTPTIDLNRKLPAIIAQGHAGRITMSCDDGKTWAFNRDKALTRSVRCWDNVLEQVGTEYEVTGCTATSCDDCDHQNWAGRGIEYGDGAFVATWGWGKPGVVQYSEDGVNWTNSSLVGNTFADVSFGSGKFLVGSWRPQVSSDRGRTWAVLQPPQAYSSFYNARSLNFIGPALNGAFIIGGDGDILFRIGSNSLDWSSPPKDSGCGGGFSRLASAGSSAVGLKASTNAVCTTSDGGQSWTLLSLPGRPYGGFWKNGTFYFWANQKMYTSSDAISWLTTDLITPGVSFGEMAMSDIGTFVMSNANWGNWYEKQKFYRSTDGVTWQTIPNGAFVGSHPIRRMVFGYVSPNKDGCQ